MTLLPPPQYDHPPSIPVLVYVFSQAKIDKFCGALPFPQRRGGCAGSIVPPQRDEPFYLATMGGSPVYWTPAPGPKCVVKIVDDVKGELLAIVRRHEFAHCNGWPKDHPSGWYDEPQH
jgi:hypothetical protein